MFFGIQIAFLAPDLERQRSTERGRELRRLFGILLFLFMATNARAAYLDLAWDSNTEPDLAGYRVYYGLESREYINFVNVGRVTRYSLGNLMDGVIYYIAITAYDAFGNESDFSAEVFGTAVSGEPNPVGETGASVDFSSGGGCFVSTALSGS